MFPSSSKNNVRPRARVLVGEPETATVPLNLRALREVRLDVCHIETTAALLGQLEAWRPQLVVLSDEFGAPIIELICQLRRRTTMPLLLIQAQNSAHDGARLLMAGADAVASHPIADELLQATIHALIRRAYYCSKPADAPSVPAQPQEGTAPKLVARVAPTVPIASVPIANYNLWPRCESCGYIGPRDRFERRDKEGNFCITCPTCNNNNVRLPIG